MPTAPGTPAEELVRVSVCIARPALRFGPAAEAVETGADGEPRAPRHGPDAGPALASLAVWLRDGDGRCTPMTRRRSAPRAGVVRFDGDVPAGQYVVCAGPVTPPLRFPPRPITVEPGMATCTFRLVEDDRPYFRMGTALVPFGRSDEHLAAVIAAFDVDAGAVGRIENALRRFRYERVIDLTRPGRAGSGDTLILEFAPTRLPADGPGEVLPHGDTVPLGEVVCRAPEVAAAAGVTAQVLRLGRLVSSDHGPVVLDNELVLGFSRTVATGDARDLVRSAGGRVVDDLSEPGEVTGPVLVVRFDHARPEAALGLAECWLDDGLLHWFEPNLVEH